jgi:hypothetical protein
MINCSGKRFRRTFPSLEQLLALVGRPNFGIWVLGYIRDLHPKDISFFDAIFAFDMAGDEYEILRSAIPLTNELIDQMRESSGDPYVKEKVLVFLNYRHVSKVPLLETNPTILSPTSLPQPPKYRAPMVNVIFNQEGGIKMGDTINMSGDFRGAILNIKSTLTSVSQSIGEIPNADPSTKENLKQLIDQLNTLLQQVPPEKAAEAEAVAESAKQLVDAAAKEKPNRATLEISAEGLKLAAKNIAEVMPTVLTIATKIVTTILGLSRSL